MKQKSVQSKLNEPQNKKNNHTILSPNIWLNNSTLAPPALALPVEIVTRYKCIERLDLTYGIAWPVHVIQFGGCATHGTYNDYKASVVHMKEIVAVFMNQ